MTILTDTAERVKKKLASEDDALTIERAVIGPTASLLPDMLFERGVRVVGGVWVKKADALLDVIAAAGSGYHFFDRLAARIVIEKPVRK